MDITVIKQLYEGGKSLAQLSKEFEISTYKLKKVLIAEGIHIRSKEEQNKYSPQNQRKYEIWDDFFDELNSTNIYLMGFLAADGSIQKDGGIKIGLSTIDKQFLEKVRTVLRSNYPIRDYITKDGFSVSEFIFRSEKIKQKLAEYGIVNNKTKTFTFPYNLPKEFYIDFIRGYFDGDGTFCMAGQYCRASLCGYNQKFLQSVVDILENQYNIPAVKIQKDNRGNTYYFQYSQISAQKLYELFYKNNPALYLPRKYDKCLQLFGEIKSHEPVTSQEEEKII